MRQHFQFIFHQRSPSLCVINYAFAVTVATIHSHVICVLVLFPAYDFHLTYPIPTPSEYSSCYSTTPLLSVGHVLHHTGEGRHRVQVLLCTKSQSRAQGHAHWKS